MYVIIYLFRICWDEHFLGGKNIIVNLNDDKEIKFSSCSKFKNFYNIKNKIKQKYSIINLDLFKNYVSINKNEISLKDFKIS